MKIKPPTPSYADSLRQRIARFLSRAIFVSLLALIAIVAVPYGSVEIWWEAFFECIVFALGALWIIEGKLSGHWLLKDHKVFVPLLAISLFSFIQTLPLSNTTASGIQVWNTISADPYETRLLVLKLLALTLAGALLLRYVSNKRRLRALVHMLIAIGLLSAFFGILRQTTQQSRGFLLPLLEPALGYGQFINRNHFAFLMEMVLGLVLGLIVARGVRREHLLIYVSLGVPIWVALVFSASRGGLFSMLAQVLFLVLLMSRGRTTRHEDEGILRRIARMRFIRPVLIAGLIATVFIGALWIGGESLTSRLETISSAVGSESDAGNTRVRRPEIWSATWDMIKDHPLLGVGFNGYWAAIPRYHNASGGQTPRQAHNDYLELLASGGVIGVALAGWFIFLVVTRARRTIRNATDNFRRAASIGACVGLFGVAVHSVVDFGLHITINALIFVALVVIAIADKRVEAA